MLWGKDDAAKGFSEIHTHMYTHMHTAVPVALDLTPSTSITPCMWHFHSPLAPHTVVVQQARSQSETPIETPCFRLSVVEV